MSMPLPEMASPAPGPEAAGDRIDLAIAKIEGALALYGVGVQAADENLDLYPEAGQVLAPVAWIDRNLPEKQPDPVIPIARTDVMDAGGETAWLAAPETPYHRKVASTETGANGKQFTTTRYYSYGRLRGSETVEQPASPKIVYDPEFQYSPPSHAAPETPQVWQPDWGGGEPAPQQPEIVYGSEFQYPRSGNSDVQAA